MSNNELLAAYPDQECPDCGEPIPDTAVEGDVLTVDMCSVSPREDF